MVPHAPGARSSRCSSCSTGISACWDRAAPCSPSWRSSPAWSPGSASARVEPESPGAPATASVARATDRLGPGGPLPPRRRQGGVSRRRLDVRRGRGSHDRPALSVDVPLLTLPAGLAKFGSLAMGSCSSRSAKPQPRRRAPTATSSSPPSPSPVARGPRSASLASPPSDGVWGRRQSLSPRSEEKPPLLLGARRVRRLGRRCGLRLPARNPHRRRKRRHLRSRRVAHMHLRVPRHRPGGPEGPVLGLVPRRGSRSPLADDGADAGRRDEMLTRIARTSRAHPHRDRGAEMLVQAMPSRRVVRATLAVESYREASVSREQAIGSSSRARPPTPARGPPRPGRCATKLDASERTRLRGRRCPLRRAAHARRARQAGHRRGRRSRRGPGRGWSGEGQRANGTTKTRFCVTVTPRTRPAASRSSVRTIPFLFVKSRPSSPR